MLSLITINLTLCSILSPYNTGVDYKSWIIRSYCQNSSSTWVHRRFFGGVRLAHLCSFFCIVLLCVFTFWVPCCDVHYDLRIKTIFCSSLRLVVCRRAYVLFTLFVFVCAQWCPKHIVLCFCFVFLSLVYPLLPVSLNCPFLIVSSVFSDVYLHSYAKKQPIKTLYEINAFSDFLCAILEYV